jgi:hypothetical protein
MVKEKPASGRGYVRSGAGCRGTENVKAEEDRAPGCRDQRVLRASERGTHEAGGRRIAAAPSSKKNIAFSDGAE